MSIAEATRMTGITNISQSLSRDCCAGGMETSSHNSKLSKKQKGKLLDMLARLNLNELALVIATGLKCEHCPVAGEKGACYDKVVCCKTMSQWLEEE